MWVYALILIICIENQGYTKINPEIIILPQRVESVDPYLTLGDILPPNIEKVSALDKARVLLKMPPPGQEIILKSEDLHQFLMLYAIDAPIILKDIVIVSLAPGPVSTLLLSQLLQQHLQQKYGSGPWTIQLQNSPDTAVSSKDIHIEQSTLNGQFFSCSIVLLGSNQRLTVNAIVKRCTKVPVVNRLILPHETIQTNDIQWIDTEIHSTLADYALKAEELVGFNPFGQSLVPGVLIKKNHLKKPKVITRGALVSLTLQTPYMVLTQRKAQAMEDGGIGDSIKVCNLDTKRIITGIVKNSRTVEVPYESH